MHRFPGYGSLYYPADVPGTSLPVGHTGRLQTIRHRPGYGERLVAMQAAKD